MYYTNFVSSAEGYFQTVICNSPEFVHTAINHDLHYISWDRPPRQHPRTITLRDLPRMIELNVPFARKFGQEHMVVMDKIDRDLLGRKNGSFTPGGWCVGENCSDVGDPTSLRPGAGALRLRAIMARLLANQTGQNYCKV
ncbi:hypothetical protein CRG98_023300 [Punica granatum]|nr:hypothetical protein CRG98_023300 [Punica granatum]